MKRRIPHLNDKGLSLVELLAAILILGIVVAPLLHAFVTSAGTAAKSRRLGDATLAAQNVAETIEATDIDKLSSLDPGLAAYGYDSVTHAFTAYSGTDPAAKYILEFDGIGGGKFDAKVTLNAAEGYLDENGTVITQYTPMDALFAQPGGELDPDTMASVDFSLEAGLITPADKTYGINRTVGVNIAEKADGTYEYGCSFNYTCTIAYTEDGTAKTAILPPLSYSYVFFSGTYNSSEDTSLASLYFFFYPYHNASTYNDEITVTHTTAAASGLRTPVKVFLAKQGDDASIYTLLVRLKEDRINSADLADMTDVYCNVTDSTYWIFLYGGHWYRKELGYFGKLVSNKEQYRLYDMTIELFDAGTDDMIYSLDASKLD